MPIALALAAVVAVIAVGAFVASQRGSQRRDGADAAELVELAAQRPEVARALAAGRRTRAELLHAARSAVRYRGAAPMTLAELAEDTGVGVVPRKLAALQRARNRPGFPPPVGRRPAPPHPHEFDPEAAALWFLGGGSPIELRRASIDD